MDLRAKKLGRTLVVYLGSAWAVIEAFSFLIQNYDMDRGLIDLIILLVLFGLPATIIYSLFSGRFNKWAVGLQFINIVFAVFTMIFFFLNPGSLNPSRLRVAKLSQPKDIVDRSLSSLAVLPFSNFMGDESKAYMLAGMHDGLINEIGQLDGIRVISSTSSRIYEDSRKDLKTIASELDVDALMEVSVVKLDTLVEFRLKLIKVFPNEKQVWFQTFNSNFSEISSLYKEVSKNVASGLDKAISEQQKLKLDEKKEVNPDAYDAYLLGKNQIGFLSRDGFEKGEYYYKRAIELDSTFAEAYYGLAFVWIAKRQMGLISPKDAEPLIEANLRIAELLDPNNAEVLLGKAITLQLEDHQWEQAGIMYQKSIEANPNDPYSRAMYAHFLMTMNQWDKAWEQMNYATTIDPNSALVKAFRAIMFLNQNKLISGFREMEELRKLEPDNFLVLFEIMFKNSTLNPEKSIESLKRIMTYIGAESLHDPIDEKFQSDGYRATVYMVAEELEKMRSTMHISPSLFVRFYGFILNDDEKTMYWFQKMYEEKDPDFPYMGIKGAGPMQDDPRYIEMMEKSGLW